jgi:hypothetical protein
MSGNDGYVFMYVFNLSLNHLAALILDHSWVCCRQVKSEMQYFKNNKAKYTPLGLIGHIPGISLGQKFDGKGEIAILGIHCSIPRGIYA